LSEDRAAVSYNNYVPFAILLPFYYPTKTKNPTYKIIFPYKKVVIIRKKSNFTSEFLKECILLNK